MNKPELVVPRERPTTPAEVTLQGVPESTWGEVCEYLARGVKINDALADLFIPVPTYRLAMATHAQLREQVAAARAVWDDRHWPEELLLRVFDLISGGKSLKEVAEELDFEQQKFQALRLRDPYVNEGFELALQIQTEGLVDEMREIVDNRDNDTIADGLSVRPNGAAPQRDRLRFEARKWMASKLLKKVYGDKVEVDLAVDVSNLAETLDNARRRKETAHAQLRERNA